MITPMRFGLKYGPIPTLTLEYEEDLGLVENDDGTRSLYVFKETVGEPASKRVRKKLHVVELPQLTVRSEPLSVVRQLQKDNHKYLGPSVVKEQQLQRLLQQLLENLPAGERKAATEDVHVAERVETVQTASTATRDLEETGESDADDGDARDESVAEASMWMETSRTDERDMVDKHEADSTSLPRSALPLTGKFITQAESDGDDDDAKSDHDDDDDGGGGDGDGDPSSSPRPKSNTPPTTADVQAEAEEDNKKKNALKSESDASEEEDVESEELEYFSEDGSDEDSF